MPSTVSPRVRLRVSAPAPTGGGEIPNAPGWAQSLTPGVWFPFTTNLLQDVDPEDVVGVNPSYPSDSPWHGVEGQKGVVALWNGSAMAKPGSYSTHGAMIMWGGGHNGYHGNEMYAVDLGLRQFVRLSDPYPTPITTVGALPYPLGVFPDNTPVMTHTCSFQGYDPEGNRVWQFRGNRENSGTPSNSTDIANSHGFSLETFDWRRTPVATRLGGSNAVFHTGGKACYDTTRQCFWLLPPGAGGSPDGRFDLFKFYDMEVPNGDGTYGKYTRYPIYTPGDIDACIHHEPVSDMLIFDDWRSANKRIYYYPLSQLGTSNSGLPFITQSGTFPSPQAGHGGWDWSPGLNAIIHIPYNGGANLYKCVKPVTAYQTNAWIWSVITAPSNVLSVPAGPTTTTVYSRLRIAKFADMELAIVVTRHDQPAYAMRIY